MDASICICAYKRPELLDTLLREIQTQEAGSLEVEVIVVDNDPAQSSAGILDHWARHSRFPMQVLDLPTPNIALARNACVEAAKGDWVAFIDDDEWPEPGWIAQLMQACRVSGADIAFGPVLPVLADDVPAWIIEGRFFERPRHATGTAATLRDARTSNALVRRALLARISGPFNPDFGRTGGEDHVLFGKLAADGARMVWADEAVVRELIPRERTTARWLLQRAFRTGQVATRAQLLPLQARFLQGKRVALALRAAGNLGAWSITALFRAPFSKAHCIRAAMEAASYLGRFLAVFGHRYQEYRH